MGSDFLPPVLVGFVSFASEYRRCSVIRSREARSPPRGQGTWSPSSPSSAQSTETAGSPRFLVEPSACVPRSQTPAGLPRQAISALPFCLPHFVLRWRPHSLPFGAQSRGPQARCPRFAGWVAPPPRRTRFRLVASLCRVGLVTHRAPLKGFMIFVAIDYITPPSPGFSWRKQNGSACFPQYSRGFSDVARLLDCEPRPSPCRGPAKAKGFQGLGMRGSSSIPAAPVPNHVHVVDPLVGSRVGTSRQAHAAAHLVE